MADLVLRNKFFPTVLDEFFDNIFNDFEPKWVTSKYPPSEVERLDDGINFKFALAGWDKDNLKIEIIDDILTITGKHDKEESKSYSNIAYRNFEIKYRLLKNLNIKESKTSFKNGLLEIFIPYKEKQKHILQIE